MRLSFWQWTALSAIIPIGLATLITYPNLARDRQPWSEVGQLWLGIIAFAMIIRLTIRGGRWIGVGVAIAFLIWAYDYDFFLNAGGPETSVSDAILRTTHLQYTNEIVIVFWPLLLLMTCGAIVGRLVSLILTVVSAILRQCP